MKEACFTRTSPRLTRARKRAAAGVALLAICAPTHAIVEQPFDIGGSLGTSGSLQFALPLYQPSSPSSFLAGVRIELDLTGSFSYAKGAATTSAFALNRSFDSTLATTAQFPDAQFGVGGPTYTGVGGFQPSKGTTLATFSADPALSSGTGRFQTRYASSVAEPYRTALPYSSVTGSQLIGPMVMPRPHWVAGDGRSQMQMTIAPSELLSLGVGLRLQDVQLSAKGRVIFDEGQLKLTPSVIPATTPGGSDAMRFLLSAEVNGQAVPLARAASAMGVHHFNFLQHVVSGSEPMRDFRGDIVPFGPLSMDPPRGGPFNLAWEYAAAVLGVPVPDTLEGKVALVKSLGAPELADRLPYYNDEVMTSSALQMVDYATGALRARDRIPGWKYFLVDRAFSPATPLSRSQMGVIDPRNVADPRLSSLGAFMTDVPTVQAAFTTAVAGVRTDCSNSVACTSPFLTYGGMAQAWMTAADEQGTIRVATFASTPPLNGEAPGVAIDLRSLSTDEWFALTGLTPELLVSLGGSVQFATPVPETSRAGLLLMGLLLLLGVTPGRGRLPSERSATA